MELALLGVSAASFVIAAGMSLIAWKLLRDRSEQSRARISLLQDAAADRWIAAAPGDALHPAAEPDAAPDPPGSEPSPAADALLPPVAAARSMAESIEGVRRGRPPLQSAMRQAGGRVSLARRAMQTAMPVEEVPPELAQFPESAFAFEDEPAVESASPEDDPWGFAEPVRRPGDRFRRPPSAAHTVHASADGAFRGSPMTADPAGWAAIRPTADPRPLFAAVTAAGSTPRANGRRLVAAVAVLLLCAGAGTAYALREGPPLGLWSRGRLPETVSPPLRLLALDHASTLRGDFTVSGVVQNPSSGYEAAGISAVIYLFGEDGRPLGSGRAPILVQHLAPGDVSTFAVTVPTAIGVARYRVGFRLEDGRVVAHVDRRSTGHADGDASGIPADHVVAPARPIRGRTEG